MIIGKKINFKSKSINEQIKFRFSYTFYKDFSAEGVIRKLGQIIIPTMI